MSGMESKRVYVGGLYHEATDKDLRQLFSKFGDVESVEIKKRSENNVVNFVFAYVNVKTSDPQITQCFRRLNGTFWKGKRLKLELARESFLAKLQREREQNRPAGRPPPPPPPPKRKTMQDRILDDVLSAKKGRRSEEGGESGGGPGGVVDFTSEESTPAPKPPAATAAVKLENGHDESYDEPKPKKKKHKPEGREREPSPVASAPPTTMKTEDGEADEPPPTRGALRMFGGIGGSPATPLSPHTAPTPKASTSSAPAPAASRGGGDFLSRLEAFSSVWGDDGGDFGAMKSPAARRVPERPAATTTTPAPAPASATTPTPAPAKPAKASPSPVKPAVKPEAKPAPVVITERRPTAAEDNEKRMASLRQKQEAFLSQKRALQLALSAKADVPRPNKRIVFDASEDEEDDQPAVEGPSSGGHSTMTPGRGGHSLFEDDEEEEGEEDGDGDDFRIRPQYEGAKGQKLQAMKARFGADDRFNLDERFADEDHDAPHEDAAEDGEEDQAVREEHRQQMDILHSVLGTAPEPERKGKKDKRNSDASAVRFDPTDESHAQYQLDSKKKKKKKENTSNDDQLTTPSKTSTPSAASASTVEAQAPTATTGSAGTFYQVAPKLGDLFGRGGQASSSSGGGGFSLLKMMGRASLDDDEEKDEEEEYKTSEIKTKAKRPSIEGAAANPFRYDSSSSEDEAEEGSTVQSLGVAAGGSGWQASKFFIQKDDSRLSEGLEWVRAAPSVEELQERAEKQRPELVELFNTQRHRRQRALQLLRGRGRGRRGHGR